MNRRGFLSVLAAAWPAGELYVQYVTASSEDAEVIPADDDSSSSSVAYSCSCSGACRFGLCGWRGWSKGMTPEEAQASLALREKFWAAHQEAIHKFFNDPQSQGCFAESAECRVIDEAARAAGVLER